MLKIPDEALSNKVNLSTAIEKKFTSAELPDRKLCVSCDQFVSSNLIYKVDYMTIIKNHEKLSLENVRIVPRIIQKIHGKNFRNDLYFKFKQYKEWLKNEVMLCDECFMSTTKL